MGHPGRRWRSKVGATVHGLSTMAVSLLLGPDPQLSRTRLKVLGQFLHLPLNTTLSYCHLDGRGRFPLGVPGTPILQAAEVMWHSALMLASPPQEAFWGFRHYQCPCVSLHSQEGGTLRLRLCPPMTGVRPHAQRGSGSVTHRPGSVHPSSRVACF